MPRRQQQRSEETRQAILDAAGRLFAERGYDSVTMREIAAAAGCSHTTIYIYFADKEALLHQLAMGPLQTLEQQAHQIAAETPVEARWKAICRTYLQFCLQHQALYPVLIMAKASRIDEATPALEIQAIRNRLLALLGQTLQAALPAGTPADRLQAYVRISFYALHGMISSYLSGTETYDQVMERLAPTFDLALDVLLTGFQHTAKGSAPLS